MHMVIQSIESDFQYIFIIIFSLYHSFLNIFIIIMFQGSAYCEKEDQEESSDSLFQVLHFMVIFGIRFIFR